MRRSTRVSRKLSRPLLRRLPHMIQQRQGLLSMGTVKCSRKEKLEWQEGRRGSGLKMTREHANIYCGLALIRDILSVSPRNVPDRLLAHLITQLHLLLRVVMNCLLMMALSRTRHLSQCLKATPDANKGVDANQQQLRILLYQLKEMKVCSYAMPGCS